MPIANPSNILIKRGDIFYAHLDPIQGSEQGGGRPVVIIQNDIGNAFAPTTIVAPLTTKAFSKRYPVYVHIPQGTGGLRADSTVQASQIRTLDKSRLGRKIGHLAPEWMQSVNDAIKVSLALG